MTTTFSEVPKGGLFKPVKGSFLYRKSDEQRAERVTDKRFVHFSKNAPVDYEPPMKDTEL